MSANLIFPFARSNENPIASARCHRLTQAVFAKKSNGGIAVSLVIAVFLWGGSNAGTKYVVQAWGPVWVGCTRLLVSGVCLLAILKWTRWLGKLSPLTAATKRDLWLRGGLSIAAYIVVFNWALYLSPASHVALYLGMSPVWTLIWEERPALTLRSAQRYGSAGLALAGVVVLFWPTFGKSNSSALGELLGFLASWLWANFGRQSRFLGAKLSGAEVSAHTMWRAGVMLLPLALLETFMSGLVLRADLFLVQGYCILTGGVIAYVLWNNALRHWQTSQVFLFNNLIPLFTMAWAYVCLHEAVTHTFWLAMALVVAGVLLGQSRWQKILGPRWAPLE